MNSNNYSGRDASPRRPGSIAPLDAARTALVVITLTCLCLAPRVLGQCTNAPAGLVSWWPAEENALDYGGGRNHGALTNGSYGTGKVGYAFSLSGSQSAVGIGNAASLQVQSFSIEGWIKRGTNGPLTRDPQGNAQILAFGAGGYAFGLTHAPQQGGFPSNSLFLTKVGSSEIDSTLVISDTNWHYVACVDSNSYVTFWLDGTNYAASGPYNPGFTFGSDASIGAWNEDDYYNNSFLGSIDELSFYTNTLGSNDILAIYHAGSAGKCSSSGARPCDVAPWGMEAWWKAEYYADDSFGTNNGTASGTGWTVGYVGNAFSDPGTNSGILLGNAECLQVQSFTVELWLQRSSASVLTYDPQGNAQALAYGPFGFAFGISHLPQTYGYPQNSLFLTKVGYSEIDSEAVISDTLWHHVAVVKSNSVVTFFLDGTNYPASGAYDPGFTFSTLPTIGAWANGSTINNSFYGNLDEVAFYSRPLSSGEIYAIYADGHAGLCGPAITNQPANVLLTSNGTATLSVGATCSTPLGLSYQWYYDGGYIWWGAANSSSYTVSNAAAFTGSYYVVVSDAYGRATSSNAVISSPPFVTNQLVGPTVPYGNSATLSATAVGTLPMSGLWYSNGVWLGTTWQGAWGGSSLQASYTVPVATLPNDSYWVVFSNVFGVVTSSVVSLTIAAPQIPDDWLLDLYEFPSDLRSELGYYPVGYSEIYTSPVWEGNALIVDQGDGSPAYLNYNVVEPDTNMNIDFAHGTILFLFSPDWSSADDIQNGNGPGDWAYLIGGGDLTSWNNSFAIVIDPTGTVLYFGTAQASYVYASAGISWAAGTWHMIGVEYNSNSSAIYLDGALAATGSGVNYVPDPSTYANGFFIGSDNTGYEQALGQFWDVECYDGPLGGYYTNFWPNLQNEIANGQGGDAPSLPDAPDPPNCVTGTNAVISNLVATVAGGSTTFTFNIEGGTNGVSYDIFATTNLTGTTNTSWTWVGSGTNCGTYELPGQSAAQTFYAPGSGLLASDGSGLSVTYEYLINTNYWGDTNGTPTAWYLEQGINPLMINNVGDQYSAQDGLLNWQAYEYGLNPTVSQAFGIWVGEPAGTSGIP